MEKLGLGHKSELNKDQGSLKAMHSYSMLQRFRSGKDVKAVDKYKPKYSNREEMDEMRGKENEWYRQNAQSSQDRE